MKAFPLLYTKKTYYARDNFFNLLIISLMSAVVISFTDLLCSSVALIIKEAFLLNVVDGVSGLCFSSTHSSALSINLSITTVFLCAFSILFLLFLLTKKKL